MMGERTVMQEAQGARDEFHLAAAAQNLRKLAKLIPMPEPQAGMREPLPVRPLQSAQQHSISTRFFQRYPPR